MTERPASRSRRWIVIAIAAPLATLAAYRVAVRVHREAPHAAAYREARDLPPLPDPADNGWVLIAESPRSLFQPEPPTLDLLADASGPPSLDALEAIEADLEAWAPPAEGSAVLDRAFARPRFVSACPLRLDDTPCPALRWLHAHRAASALALREAVRGWDEEALARATAILRADRDALLHARSLIEAMVAAASAAEAIELAAMLGAILGARDEAAATPSLLGALDAMEAALSALEPSTWSVERALIGEAIRIQSAIAALGSAEGGDAMDRWRMARLADEHFEATLAYARAPDGSPPAPPEPDWLWRVLDPAGATALEVIVPDMVPHIDRFEEGATDAEDRVAAARVAIAAARARIERSIAAERGPALSDTESSREGESP